MQNSMTRIAVAGCGKVAYLHGMAIKNIPDAKLAACWSRSEQSALTFAEKFKCKAFRTITEMVKAEEIDLVIVCTPHPYHKDPVIETVRNGAHVLVEKPLASTLSDCDEMIDACKHAGVKLGVISQRRWYKPVQRVKHAIEQGKIGQPVLGTIQMLGWRDRDYYEANAWRGTWKMEGGGVLVNQAPHQLDILLWYMGDIDEVYGHWNNLNHPYMEVDDTALAIVKFQNGAVGNILVSNSQKPGIYGKVHVHGENGASVGVQTDGGAMFIAGKTGVAEPPVNDVWTIHGEEHNLHSWKEEDAAFFQSNDPTWYYMKCQIEDFMESVKNNREPLVTGEFGRKTVELFTAIYRSTRDNKPVQFPLKPESSPDMDGRLQNKH